MTEAESQAYFSAEWAAHERVAAAAKTLTATALPAALQLMADTLRRGNTIFFCGNGGSAADAQHLAAELSGRFRKERGGMAAIALTTDTSALTAIGNDYGFERIFSRQVEALARPGDLLVALSTSGNSPNVLQALEAARSRGCSTLGFSGQTGGQMAARCDLCLCVPSPDTARIQEIHILMGHLLCGALEQKLSGN